MSNKISTAQLLAAWKAAGEATRLRILALLQRREQTVGDLTRILEQSQPRISRHLRLLAEAGLIERFKEGSFVYCRLSELPGAAVFVQRAIVQLDQRDPVLVADRKRAEALQIDREQASQIWFKANAAKWDQIRSLHVAESEVEAAMSELLTGDTVELLLDLGTGTGRMLELFADRARQLIGVDASHSMLEYARLRLAQTGNEHCQLRQGDLTDLAYGDGIADIVILHQVLHHLIEPEKALQEAARVLKSGGKLLLVDFAPHDLDFLRDEFKHERLGFAKEQIGNWMKKAGLTVSTYRQLSAETKNDERKLTVSMWLAKRSLSSFKKTERRSSVSQGE